VRFALLFPGQGSQYPGMCSRYIQEFPYIKKIFSEANEILNFDILDLCLNGSEEKLKLTANAQPSILLLSYCGFRIFKAETGINPFLLAGHSLGEIPALCCSGGINFPDALRIVRKRGELMQVASTEGKGTMLAINGLPALEIQKLCEDSDSNGNTVISNINSKNQIVISGEKKCVELIGDQARVLGAVAIPLKVSAPFHSPLMKSAAAGLETELNKYTYFKLEYPVMSNVTCKPYFNENEIIPLLTEQVTSVVNWQRVMEYIMKTSVEVTLELPPKSTLTRLLKDLKSRLTCYSFEQLDEILILSKRSDNEK